MIPAPQTATKDRPVVTCGSGVMALFGTRVRDHDDGVVDPYLTGGTLVNVIVVYESVWGNTAAVARAIAEGIGPDAAAHPTDEVPKARLATVDLIVAGSPVFGFSLPTEGIRERILKGETDGPAPDLAHPSLRSWLDGLPAGRGRCAAFETRVWWSPRGATGTIEKKLAERGYPRLVRGEKFVVRDKYGPLRDGELERARAWGRTLREALITSTPRAEAPAA